MNEEYERYESIVIEDLREIKIRDKDFLILTINDTDKHRFYRSPYECMTCKQYHGKINSDRRINLLWSLNLPIENIRKTTGESLVWPKCGHSRSIQLSYLQRVEIQKLLNLHHDSDKVKQLFEWPSRVNALLDEN